MPYSLTFEQVEELILLLKEAHGIDLSGYSRASLLRRFERVLRIKMLNFTSLKVRIVNQRDFLPYLIDELAVNVTEMFRDPEFWAIIRAEVLPYLNTYPFFRSWFAGCATGEEVFSYQILLEEEGLLKKSFTYATDISQKALEKARQRFIDPNHVRQYEDNYKKSAGKADFKQYLNIQEGTIELDSRLTEKVLFASHNLITDAVFNEFRFVVCRNVLIYFQVDQQEKVIGLLVDSLMPLGFLCLGPKEQLRPEALRKNFKVISKKYNIFQRVV